MTTIDKTGASAAEFEARVAPFEADDGEQVETLAMHLGIPLPEDRLETVARAIAEAQGVGRTATPLTRRLAAAAIAALPPSPAERAVKRVEALAEEWASRCPADDWGSGDIGDVVLADAGRALLAALDPAGAGDEAAR